MNYKIIVRSTCIIINDYIFGSCPKLEANFKLYNMVTHSFYFLGLYYDEENSKLYLPRGIDLWFVQKCLNAYDDDIYFESPDEYEYVKDIGMKYGPRDDVQKECLQFMLGLDKYEDNKSYSQLSVNLNTGKGKTFVSIYTMAYTKIKSIVITSINSWLDQWAERTLEYTNLTKKDICKISGASAINMLLYGKSKQLNASLFLINHSTIKSYGDTYGWDKIRLLFQKLKIGNMFIDEAHLNFENICRICFATNVYKTYFITATPARSDEYENNIYQLAMKNVPSIDLFDEEEDKRTNYVAIKWNSRPNPQQISDCKNQYGLDRNKYTNYVVDKQNFEYMMYIIMDLVLKCDGKVLMYIGTNEAILKVYKWISEHYPELLGEVGIYTSIATDKEIEKNKKLILSTTKSAGAAMDVKGLKLTIVLAEPFKSEVIARQTLGRTRDNNTMYIELVDLGFYKIKQYYYAKLPVFNTYALSTSDMEFNQIQLESKVEELQPKREEIMRKSTLKVFDPRFDIGNNALKFDIPTKRNAINFY